MITYQGFQLSPFEFRQVVEGFLETEQRRGTLALDPHAACYSRDLYALYVQWCERNQVVPGSKNAFGRALTALGSPIIQGTGGYPKRGGIRLQEAPCPAVGPDAS